MGEVSLILDNIVPRDSNQDTPIFTQKEYVQDNLEQFEMLDSKATQTSGYGAELPNKKLGGVYMVMTKRPRIYLLNGHRIWPSPASEDSSLCATSPPEMYSVVTWRCFYMFAWGRHHNS